MSLSSHHLRDLRESALELNRSRPLWQSKYSIYHTIIMEDHTDQPPPAYRPTPTHPRTGAGSFRHEHRYALQGKSGSDWVTFKVKSRAADPKHTPLFFDGDIIKGEVRIDLPKAETLKGLTITVCASLS